eukprot:TRINITY_DN812_c0_g1_i1.p1 TRINITY_DN812_c0_g1~~TRINITY_DN812_c0_g1_i1.p1  ORF type:complete len:214 (+),score=65.86 TRINITY_DN812_c0_g1_i1:37-642(+)
MSLIEIAEATFDDLESLSTNDDGWEFVKEKDGVNIHLRQVEGSPIVMMRGQIDIDCAAPDCLVITEDLESRKDWDELFIEGKVIEEIDDTHQVLHFKFKAPSRLITNRDFLMARAVKTLDDGTILANHVSCEHDDCPEQKGFVRGEIKASGYHFKPTGDNSCKATYVVQIDPKGWIPTWLVNTVATKQPLILAKVKAVAEK